MAKAFSDLSQSDQVVLEYKFLNYEWPSIAMEARLRSGMAAQRRYWVLWKEIDPEDFLDGLSRNTFLYSWVINKEDLPALAQKEWNPVINRTGKKTTERIVKFLAWFKKEYKKERK